MIEFDLGKVVEFLEGEKSLTDLLGEVTY